MSVDVVTDPTPGPTSAGLSSRQGQDELAWRVLRLLNVFRLIIAAVFVVTFMLVRDPGFVGDFDPPLAAAALSAMLLTSLVEIPLLRAQWPSAGVQTLFQFVLDLVVVTLLMHASGGITTGFGGLLVVSTGSLALLMQMDRALAMAAATTFVLLIEQFVAQLQGMSDSAAFAQAGILSAVIFVITGVVQLLRSRIVETEALAAQRGVDLQNLVELNDYIIQHLRESIVVVDGDNRIRLINESAAKLLRQSESASANLDAVAPELAQRLSRWRQGGEDSQAQTSTLSGDENLPAIQPHFAHLGSGRSDGVVIFLEDISLISERVQQTKLAALGRLSASIAHEIRNPLGALSHAGQLLAESQHLSADDHRLTDIIRVNSLRVSNIVDSVLALSRSDRVKVERIAMKQWAQDFAAEFIDTQELFEGAVSVPAESDDVDVEMDRTHLHQVVWNLCDNAVKYASKEAGAIAVELRCGFLEASGRPYLEVADRGPGVDADRAEEIFEPFYTAQPGGTGLGLYISRELCERNRATLRYHPRPGGGSLFRIVFSDPTRWQTAQ